MRTGWHLSAFQRISMKKSRFNGTKIAWVVGVSLVCWFFTRSAFPVVALGFVFLGLYCAVSAMKSFHRARTLPQGRGGAIARGLLGGTGALMCLLILSGLFIGRLNQQQVQRHSPSRMHRVMATSALADEPAAEFTSNLPIIVLKTAGRYISSGTPTVVKAQIHDTGNGRASLRDQPAYVGLASINLRGYSTRNLPKNSYTLHTLDSNTNQSKVSLLGLPAEEDWVLYAPFEDKTMMRDVLAFELTRRMGRYAPRTRYVELFIQGGGQKLSMRDYAGVYVLVEKIKRGPDRVNVAKLNPQHRSEPEISGGYIVKRDHSDSPGSRFHTSRGGPYFYVYPKARHITQEQKTWLRGYFNSFETALYGSEFADPQKGYAAFLDVDSFIDAHFLIEVGKNVDGFRYSTFLTKDREGKLKPEPPWDWNRSFGNANYYGGGHVRGWYSSNLRPNEVSWYHRLKEDPAFMSRCAKRWAELRRGALNVEKIHELIDTRAALLAEAQERNFKRWPILGQSVTCNYFVGDTFQEEVDWLKSWIADRIEWIDNRMSSPVEF